MYLEHEALHARMQQLRDEAESARRANRARIRAGRKRSSGGPTLWLPRRALGALRGRISQAQA